VSNHAVNMFIDLADVVFIDEVSMCLGGFLQEIHQRSIDASAMSNDEPFAGKVVVFSGDVHQLPAVCVDRSCTDLSKCPHQPYRWPMWNLFKELSLNTNHRHNPNAPEFINALNHMRCERFELGCQHLEAVAVAATSFFALRPSSKVEGAHRACQHARQISAVTSHGDGEAHRAVDQGGVVGAIDEVAQLDENLEAVLVVAIGIRPFGDFHVEPQVEVLLKGLLSDEEEPELAVRLGRQGCLERQGEVERSSLRAHVPHVEGHVPDAEHGRQEVVEDSPEPLRSALVVRTHERVRA